MKVWLLISNGAKENLNSSSHNTTQYSLLIIINKYIMSYYYTTNCTIFKVILVNRHHGLTIEEGIVVRLLLPYNALLLQFGGQRIHFMSANGLDSALLSDIV